MWNEGTVLKASCRHEGRRKGGFLEGGITNGDFLTLSRVRMDPFLHLHIGSPLPPEYRMRGSGLRSSLLLGSSASFWDAPLTATLCPWGEGARKRGCPLGRLSSGGFFRISPQVVSEGVPVVLALVPHRQSHSFITQGSSDLLVSALGRVPFSSSLLPLPRSHLSALLPTGDCECQRAAGHSQLVALRPEHQ